MGMERQSLARRWVLGRWRRQLGMIRSKSDGVCMYVSYVYVYIYMYGAMIYVFDP